jgi:hypothetical protein
MNFATNTQETANVQTEIGATGNSEVLQGAMGAWQVLAGKGFCANSKTIGIEESSDPRITDRKEAGQLSDWSGSLSG